MKIIDNQNYLEENFELIELIRRQCAMEPMTFPADVTFVSLTAAREASNKRLEKVTNDFAEFYVSQVKLINALKAKSNTYITIRPENSSSHVVQVGINIKHNIDGYDVYTGDEIQVIDHPDKEMIGKLGFIESLHGKPYFRTNAECWYIGKTDKYKITRHFIEYDDGDKIAIGRRTGHGFIVEIN